jgi:hypothetical protein
MNTFHILLLICAFFAVLVITIVKQIEEKASPFRVADQVWIILLALVGIGFIAVAYPPWVQMQTVALRPGSEQVREITRERNVLERDLVRITVESRHGHAFETDLPRPQKHNYAALPRQAYYPGESEPRHPVVHVIQEWRRDWLLLFGEILSILGMTGGLHVLLGPWKK